jgi:hypothetical protein
MFRVQSKPCQTCIYRSDSSLDIKKLEDQIRDPHMGFKGHRICHHSKDACCRGFWQRHKNKFQLGQIAQRLNIVEFVNDDILMKGQHMETELRKKLHKAAKQRYEEIAYDLPTPGNGHYSAAMDCVSGDLYDKFQAEHPKVNWGYETRKALKGMVDDDRILTRSKERKFQREIARIEREQAKPPKPIKLPKPAKRKIHWGVGSY